MTVLISRILPRLIPVVLASILLASYSGCQAKPQAVVSQPPAKTPIKSSTPAPSKTHKHVFVSPTDFVQTIYPHAKAAAKELGIDPKVLVAQAAHETNWGKRIPKIKNGGSSYNIFGMKTATTKSPNKVIIQTKEYRKGKLVREKAGFRVYQDYQEAFNDYIGMLKRSSRYQTAVKKAHLPYEFLAALQKSGYATDPAYAKKIYAVYQSSIIKRLG